MKQKIVIKLHDNCDGCRSKAMKIAANFCGVSKMEIQGKDRDELALIADGVDSVKLTRSLRKKLHCAEILSVQEEKEKKEEKKEEKPKCICYPYTYTCPYTPYPPVCAMVCDEPGAGTCSIM